MNLPTQNQQLASYQPALGGLFSWLRKTVNRVSKLVTLVSPFLGGLLDDFTNGDGSFVSVNFGNLVEDTGNNGFWGGSGNPNNLGQKGTFNNFQEVIVIEYDQTDEPLTAAEEVVLDKWVDQKFVPFFTPYLSRLKAFIANPPSVEVFNDTFNDIQEFIGFLMYYQIRVLTSGEPGFTYNAINARNNFMNTQIALLQDQLRQYVKSTGMQIKTNTVKLSINKSDYAPLGFNVPNVFSITTKVVAGVQTVDGGGTVVSDAPIEPTAPTSNKGTSNSVNILIGLLAAYGIYRFSKKK